MLFMFEYFFEFSSLMYSSIIVCLPEEEIENKVATMHNELVCILIGQI